MSTENELDPKTNQTEELTSSADAHTELQPDLQPEADTQAVPQDTNSEPQGVRAFDQDGREVIIPREEWATNVLPNLLKENLDNPDQLYGLIVNSLNDGFIAEVTDAAQHLYQTDTVPARGATMWGLVLMNAGRMDEAEQVFEGYLKQHGEDGSIMINLAKIFASRGETERADATLARGLELEPNLENGLGWFVALEGEKGGDPAAKAALEKIGAYPGAWRAQLWLARAELMQSNLGRARELYNEALGRAPRPLPADFLMQMSGDLGQAGALVDLITFTAPFYVAEMHGLPVGNNLIKAYIDTGNLGAAAAIKNALQALGRPENQQALGFWDQEISKRLSGGQNQNQGQNQGQPDSQIQIGMLRVDGPVWLPPQSPARSLFGQKAGGGSTVTFLGGTAEVPNGPEAQMSDAVGRLTRSLPMFLAEQVQMRTAAEGRAMIPWAVAQTPEQRSGFVVSGSRWPDDASVQMVSDPANKTDYVVSVHIDAEVEPWTADLAFIRTSDGTRIGELTAEFPSASPQDGLPKLAEDMVDLLGALGAADVPEAYQVPQGAAFSQYLLRMEQLLAVRCAGMPGVQPMQMNGEGEILQGDLQLCQDQPKSIPARLLLIETLGALTVARPQVAEAFRADFEQLIQDYPIAQVDEAFRVPANLVN